MAKDNPELLGSSLSDRQDVVKIEFGLSHTRHPSDTGDQPPPHPPHLLDTHGEEAPNSRWESMLGPDPSRERRLHHPAGLSSSPSAPSSDEDDGINSDATFTGSEVALARESTLVLPSRRLMETTPGLLVSSHKLSMGKVGSKSGQTMGGNNNPLSSGGNTKDNQIKDPDQDFRTSCLARTPSGSIFIPSDIPKCPLSVKQKSDTPVSHGTSLHEDAKNADRCHISYSSATAVPVLPVRNNLRRPMSSHFTHSRFHFRKTLSSRCSWKCTAITFMFVSLALLTSLTYFIAVAVFNWQYANKQPCPVMIEDMGRSNDGSETKSMYPLSKSNLQSVHSRKIRDIDSMQSGFATSDFLSSVAESITTEFTDIASGDHAPVVVSVSDRSDSENADVKTLDLGDDYLFLAVGSESTNSDIKTEKPFVKSLSPNEAKQSGPSFLMQSDHLIKESGSMSEPSAAALMQHDAAAVFAMPMKSEINATDSGISSLLEEGIIEPPILLPKNNLGSEEEIPGNSVEHPEYEIAQVNKLPVPVSQPSVISYDTLTETSTTNATVTQNANNFTFPSGTDVSASTVKPSISIIEPETSFTEVSPVEKLSTENIAFEDKALTFESSNSTTALPETSSETSISASSTSSNEEMSSLEIFTGNCCVCSKTTLSSDAPAVITTTTETSSSGPSSLPSKTLPPMTESFSEVHLGKIYTHKVASFGHWNIHFHQRIPSLVKFNYSLPEGASIGIYGRKNGVPTHTRYDFVEILDTGKSRNKRATKEVQNMEFVQFLDQGLWYISIYNDGEQPQQVAFVPLLTDQSSLPCPYDCHGHGACVMGSCICESDYAGEACANRVCPVLCSGRGHYVSGECFCSPGWKGKECQLREDECEITDCNGHGDCLDGICRCFPGYKGFHCEEVDCLDPDCSGHGVCANGMCICRKGWKGADCGEPDTDSLRCLPDCSEQGHFDVELQRCVCDEHWSGPDCSQERCDLDCGTHGRCQGNMCICLEGWSGVKCSEKQCDPRCLEHGQCNNGTCLCIQGWNGQHCTLEGCPQACYSHGQCIQTANEWRCQCNGNWGGIDCSIPLEKTCDDRIDNDNGNKNLNASTVGNQTRELQVMNWTYYQLHLTPMIQAETFENVYFLSTQHGVENDGLIDCADSECCSTKPCENNPLCFASPDPLEILLRKQPPAVTASFFQRMQFLIEEDSVQSYAHKTLFNDSRASVIRGRVISPSGNGLMGVRVSVATDHLFGFTITRDTGWFDLMVNGGGAVNLQFQREPFKPHEHTVVVPWNEIVVVSRITMSISEDKLPDYKSIICLDHDYDTMKPVVLATWKHGFQGGCPGKSSVLAESQVIQESLSIPGTNLHLVYHSSRMGGYLSTIQLRLTPDEIPSSLRLIHLRISIEGILFEKTFEADSGIKFTYSWNRRNIYRQKVYGVATASVSVGYEYSNCPHTIWEIQTTQVSGHDMSISEIGGWNLDIHHRYNFHEGILQKGDGTNIYLKNKPKVLITTMGDGHQRPMHCHQCNGIAQQQRLLAPVALASAPDGSIYVGDFNLIRRIMPDNHVTTVVELSAAQVAYRYHLAVGPADGKLYISDPEKHQIFRIIAYSDIPDIKNNIEAVVGNGGKCLPGDKMLCGDGRAARDAKLAYPKGMSISAYGEIYIADGTNIRMVDRSGIIHTIIGDHYHKSHWKPFPCGRTVSLTQVNLRWPTELAINPLDSSLHILDDHMVLRLTPDKRLKVIAGRPIQCPIPTVGNEKSDISVETYLESPQSISFAPNGDLYIAESDSQMVNRVRVISSDGRITTFAGAESKCSCLDVNCKCFDEDHFLAATSKLSTISSIVISPDGRLHICDQGNLRVRSVAASLPKPNEFGEFEIYSPETQEIYIFNRHGQHTSTKNILTDKVIYTFSYNVNTSYGKLSTVTDAAGNKIYILRDYSNQVNTIENTQGGKCRLEMSRMRMLQGFTTPDNFKTTFEYQGSTGLLRSKIDSSRKAYVYSYDAFGRLIQAVTPTGQVIKLNYNLSMKGASVTVTRNDQNALSLLIKGSDVTTKTGMAEQRTTQYQDGSLILTLDNSKTLEMETVPSPVLVDQSPVLGEIFPVPAKLKATLSDDVVQRFEWKYYLRREGKGKNRQITQVGRKMKVNGEILVAVEFDREQYSEVVYDKNQIPLVTVHYDALGRPLQWQPSQNITAVKLEYDRFGRLAQWERGSLSERYSFDIQGRLAEVRYSDNSGIMYKYDEGPVSLPTEVILPSGSRYLLQYDSVGSLQTIVTPNGHKHEIATQISIGFYKLLYLSPGVKYPYVLQFNDQGQVLVKLLPKNKGRVLYRYNEDSHLATILVGEERTDIHYYEQRSLVKSIVKIVPGLELKVDFRYHGSLLKEERHRFNSRSGMDGAKFKYLYDGRLASAEVEINGKGTSEIKYKYNTETGVLEQTQQFIFHRPKINSIFIQDEMRQYSKTIGLDAYGRIVVLAVTLWNKEIFSLNLLYDNRNRVKQSHVKIGRDAVIKVTNYTYTLDGFLEEMTSSESWKFIYDINGNMKGIWEGQHQLSLRYDDGDRLIGYGDVELYVVDTRGFIVQRGEEKFQFNSEGHLIHAFELHQYEAFYYYDVKGRLIARKDHRGNITQYFYTDPLHHTRLTHMHYPQDGVTFIYIYDSNDHLMYIQQGGVKYYVASDHLGTPVALFSSEGALVKEIHRTPFGKVTIDTNVDFYLPIDFQGGIRDPLTQLIHFHGRVYDPLGAQWLTPSWESIPQLLKAPYNLHLYRFHANDPINVYEEENHLTELKNWLSAVGFEMNSILLSHWPSEDHSKAPLLSESLPVISGLSCSVSVVSAEFQHFSTVPKTEVKVNSNFLRTINSRIGTIQSVLGDGIILSHSSGKAVVNTVSDSPTILRDVVTTVFNDTYLLNLHFSAHGQDSFYFVQEDSSRAQRNWDQLQRLGTMFNVTMHNVDPNDGSNGQVDLRVQSPSVIFNIRYGTTVSDEYRRLIHLARQRAVEEAWQHETELIQSGHKGSYEWSKTEKDELLSSGSVAKYHGSEIHNISEFPELADDPSNIIFKKDSSRKRRNRPRKPK